MRTESGFSLIETMVSLAIVATTTLVTTLAVVRAMSVTRLEGDKQAAVQLAADLVDDVLAVPYQSLVQRGTTAGDGYAVTALTGVVATTQAVASATQDRTVDGVNYRATWFATPCTKAACTVQVSSTVAVPLLELTVVVTWPAKECADRPGSRCVFTTSSLINPVPTSDAGVVVLPTSAAPVPTPAPTTATPVPTTVPPTTAAPTTTPPTSATPVPTPLPAAIWSTGELSVKNTSVQIIGQVHTNADAAFAGSNGQLSSGVEYVTGASFTGSTMNMPPAKKVTAGTPVSRPIANYRPGGSAAVAAGAGYKQISCSGTWNYSAAMVGSATIVYAPCTVQIATDGVYPPLIVAEGGITVKAATAILGDAMKPYNTGLISNGDILLNGGSAIVYGNIQALNGEIDLTGSSQSIRCGVVGKFVIVNASSTSIIVDNTCIP